MERPSFPLSLPLEAMEALSQILKTDKGASSWVSKREVEVGRG